MKQRYQIDRQRAVQQFRQLASQENPNIQMVLPMVDIVGLLRTWPANATSSMWIAARTAGAKRTATAWWTARRCR